MSRGENLPQSSHAATVSIRPAPLRAALRILVQPALTAGPEVASRIARVWDELRAANNRYYDGPILRTVSIDLDEGELLCRRDTFRSLAVSARLGLGVRQLGVTGIITARDDAGASHVLLGRRGTQTRIYPGLWELAPSGGVKPPPPNIVSLSLHDLALALAEEAEEELGMSLDPREGRLVAFLRDETACSDDAVLRFDLSSTIDPRRGACPLATEAAGRWEYIDSAWIATTDLGAFTRDHADAITPPTAALLRWLDLA